MFNSYQKKEDKYLQTVRHVHCKNVTRDAEIIFSYVFYKNKREYDDALQLEERIAHYGNNEDKKDKL